jgi:cytochrome c oxidase cbb3-type subunit 3
MLTALISGFTPPAIADEESPASTGRQLFNSYCFLCHGTSGTGDGNLAAKMGISDVVADLTASKYGAMSSIELAERIAGYKRGASMMPAWKEVLDARQISQIASYVQTLSLKHAYLSGKDVYYSNCAMCHGANGKGTGAIAKQLDLVDRMPDLTSPRYVNMSQPDLAKLITSYRIKDPKKPIWESQLDENALNDVAAYIRMNPKGLEALGNKLNGKTVFLHNCIACHGKGGKGDGPLAALLQVKMIDYTSKDSSSISDAQLIHTISMGVGNFMPAWYRELSEYDVRDVAAYVRSLYKTE